MATNADLFKGLQAVEVAGGVDGFAREVMAETKTAAFQALRQRGAADQQEANQVFTEALKSVIVRRLKADFDREVEREVQRLMLSKGVGLDQACDEVFDLMLARQAERVGAILEACF